MRRHVMETQWQQKEQIPTEVRITKIRNYGEQRIQYSTASPLRLGGGSPCKIKRKKSDCLDPAPPSSGTGATMAAELEKLLDTCTDTQFALATILCQYIHRGVLSGFCQGFLRFSSSGFMKGMLGYVRVVRGMKGILGYVRVVRVRGTPRYAGAGTGDAAVRRGLARGTPLYVGAGTRDDAGDIGSKTGGHREVGGTPLPYRTVPYRTLKTSPVTYRTVR